MDFCVLVYGAGGAAQSLSRALVAEGMSVEIAGRSPERVAVAARALGVPHRIADVRDRASVLSALDGISVVINAAGPFAQTAAPLMSAALTRGVHYIDLSNEYASHLHASSRNEDAVARQTAIVCGAGFGSSASELAALNAVAEVEASTDVEILFMPRGGSGTVGVLRSTLALVAAGGRAVVGGAGRRVSVRDLAREEALPSGETACVIPAATGDLVAAARSTRVPNIVVMTPLPLSLSLSLARNALPALSVLLRPGWVREAVVSVVVRRKTRSAASATSSPARPARVSYARATATNAAGESHTSLVTIPSTRGFMAAVCSALIEELRDGDVAGCRTPGQVLGRDRLQELAGLSVPAGPAA